IITAGRCSAGMSSTASSGTRRASSAASIMRGDRCWSGRPWPAPDRPSPALPASPVLSSSTSFRATDTGGAYGLSAPRSVPSCPLRAAHALKKRVGHPLRAATRIRRMTPIVFGQTSTIAVVTRSRASRGSRHRDERQQEPGEGITSSRFVEEPSAIVDRQARIDGLEGGHRAPGTCEAEPACGTGDGPVSHLGQRLVPAQPAGAIGYAVCPVIVRFRDRRLLLLPEQGEKLGLVLAEQHQVLSRDAADVVQPWPMGLELDA